MANHCEFCEGRPQYRDRQTGQYLCLEHARLQVAAPTRRPSSPPLAIRPAMAADYARVEELALYFWDETDVECFDRQYDVLACPAFLACDDDRIVGLASYAVEGAWQAIVQVMLNLLPDWQGRGGGRALLEALREEAARRGLARILVVTSNDDLPALALYQRYGFRIIEVIPGRLAQHHGAELAGFAGIPVRDEIRLEVQLEVRGKNAALRGAAAFRAPR